MSTSSFLLSGYTFPNAAWSGSSPDGRCGNGISWIDPVMGLVLVIRLEII
jgi:hypothetical protein